MLPRAGFGRWPTRLWRYITQRNATALGRGIRYGFGDLGRGGYALARTAYNLSPPGYVNAALEMVGVHTNGPNANRVLMPVAGAAVSAGNYLSSRTADPRLLLGDAGALYSKAATGISNFSHMDAASQQEVLFEISGRVGVNVAAAVATGGLSRATTAADMAEAVGAADRVAISAARADQVRWGYSADEWGVTQLKAGDTVFGGLPGQSAYYTDAETLAASGGSRSSLFESLQVKAHPEFGYRPAMGEYEVVEDMRVPFGTARANPSFGAGGGNQFFIQNYSDRLRLVREHSLGH